MKKTFLISLFICLSISLNAQMYEIGIFGGGSNFVGDIGATEYIKPNRPALGMVFKYNINPRMALRTNFTYFDIAGLDSESDNRERVLRDFSFENNLNEFAFGLEYNFFEYDISTKGEKATPYILLQLGAVDYKTPRTTNLNGDVIFTRRTALTIPMGLGFKSVLFGKIAFAIEARVNYTFTDGIDFTTTEIPSLNFGGSGNDWYMFTGFSLVYAFGRPPCYAHER